MINRSSGIPLSGLEVKLTTLPDNTTKDLPDEDYGSEIVVRSPTILFLACSICACYDSPEGRMRLHDMLNTIGEEIRDWGEIRQVVPHYEAIKQAVLYVSRDLTRISKYEIKNIILGNGQKLLRPERRFDAYLVSHPELFE